MTAPGDMKNNLKILQNEVRYMKYPDELDLTGVMKGKPQAFLPLYNHAFNNFSPEFTAEVVALLDEGLFGKSDLRFMEAIYRVLRDMFNYKPSITKDQFFSTSGFAERKVMMCGDVLKMVRERCRALGPHKPTNPSIKVSAVIDNRRASKGGSKQSLENLATLEPSTYSMSRKTASRMSPRPLTAPSSLHSGLSGRGTSVKVPSGEDNYCTTNFPRSPSPGRALLTNNTVEVVNVQPNRSPEVNHARVVDVIARSPDQSLREPSPRDHTEAMETILAKVRDLPTQLASFMQAVECRLQKVEERLEHVEEAAKEKPPKGGVEKMVLDTQDDLRQQMETFRARILLLENRVMLAETRVPTKELRDSVQPPLISHEKLETDNPISPFVSLERGGCNLPDIQRNLPDDSFANSLVKHFSPIRREGVVFGNDTLSNLSDPNPRRSSTPTHPTCLKPVPAAQSEATVAEGGEPDLSFQQLGLDTSTQKQVDRIKDMLQNTKQLLPTSADNPINSKA